MAVTYQAPTVTFNTIVAAAYREVIQREPREQSYQKNTAVALLEEKESTFGGGTEMHVNVSSVGTSRAQAIEKATQIALTDSDDVTIAKYRRAYYRQPIVIWETEEDDADTDEKLFDLVVHKLRQGKLELNNKIATDFWATSATTSPQSLAGIVLAAPTDGGSSTAYGGLTATGNNTWWASQSITTGGVASSVLLNQIDQIDQELSAGGGERWSFAFTSKALFRILKQQVRTYHQITVPPTKASQRVGDLDYEFINYGGRPIMWDRSAVSGRMYFFNDKACELAVKRGMKYKLGPWVRLESNGQFGRAAFMKWGGQFVVRERRLIGQISGLTES